MNAFRISRSQTLPVVAGALLAVLLAGPADALQQDRFADPAPQTGPAEHGDFAAQRGAMSLSEAVESVRQRGDVERIISAETRVANGRETHHIRAMTKDGKVKTFKVPGRRRD